MPNIKAQQKFGKNLRVIRQKKGLSQEEASKVCQISVTYFAGIERGERNPSLSVIESICKGLNIRISEILPF